MFLTLFNNNSTILVTLIKLFFQYGVMYMNDKFDRNTKESHDILNKAIIFAVKRHAGQTRKGTTIPYITHPLETLATLNTMRADMYLLAAGVLHDVLEDTDTTEEELKDLFGEEIAELVKEHTEDKSKSWLDRKKSSIKKLQEATKREKMLVMADKSSNLRNLLVDYTIKGSDLWRRFNAPKEKQAWYYSSIIDALADMQVFDDTADIYWDMVGLYKDVFVTYVYDQSEKIIYQLDTNGENYYLKKGDTKWYPFENEKISSQALVIPRSDAERLEDNWYVKYGKRES